MEDENKIERLMRVAVQAWPIDNDPDGSEHRRRASAFLAFIDRVGIDPIESK